MSLLSKGLSRVFSSTKSLKASVLQHSAFFTVQLSNLYMTTGKTIVLTVWTSVSKVMSLLFNMLSRFVIAFLLRSKYLFISWLQLPPNDFGAQENKICHCFHFPPLYLPLSVRTGCHDLSFLNIEFKPDFHSLSPSSRGSLAALHFLP